MNIVDFIDSTVKRNMYTDISTTIKKGLPVLTAIGLFAYSEMLGGLGRIVDGEPETIVFGPGQGAVISPGKTLLRCHIDQKRDPEFSGRS